MTKRLFDISASFFGLLLLSPLFLVVALCVGLTGRGGVFYVQTRVGRYGRDFKLYKFRSMRTGSDAKGLLTVGGKDGRITPVGYFIRKYKIDELPQLFNVLKGDMSLVGPRPEVRKYVALYNSEQMRVLSARPGITDPASIKYRNENDLLAQADDPERFYVEKIMPDKLKINLEYMDNRSFFKDLSVIFRTVF
ncbi:MAG TPA: sugar transferase [Candidatus Onthomorpha intestinigallinarum]|uniref:Sugar transferase n=1 Tax=Candidatus Onthomorpha intestinigallinarum TaxID=2840880 RepID=A0A9D1UGB8_9BACT|nr:sugar transferase [Candidatus Onthomorpha intestinigallinarum]